MANFPNSTLLSGVGVVAAVAVFGFALYSFYPSSNEDGGAVPLIQAEAVPIKIEPAQDGGMEIPFRDSTVFGSAREASNTQGGIENLLEAASAEDAAEPLNKEALIAQSQTEAEGAMNITEQPATTIAQAKSAGSATAELTAEQKKADAMAALETPVAVAAPADAVPPAEALSAPSEIAQEPKIIDAPKLAEVESEAAPADKTMHEPATSPETLAFVRSVLDKKDAEKGYSAAGTAPVAAEPVKSVEAAPVKSPAAAANGIEPAAGTEGVINAGPKTHYVQLASIPDRAKADAEWAKLKSSFSALPGSSSYRVEEANLGERGTYYRIQAGPYSEGQAKSICESIKAQKPGGCLIVR